MTQNPHRVSRGCLRGAAVALVCGMLLGGGAAAVAQQEVVPPKPTVPEVFTLMGEFVRVAYDNRGFVTLGYRVAQGSVGGEWMLLEVGLTVREPVKNFTLKREHLSLKTPDGATIALASQEEYAKADEVRGLNSLAKASRDKINYFPVEVMRTVPLKFFANPGEGGSQLSYDQVELGSDRAALGRIYFHVPGGIKVGQHWLIVRFGESEVQVPFRILTKEEEKEFRKSWQEIKKGHDASLGH